MPNYKVISAVIPLIVIPKIIWSIKPFFTGSHLGFKHIPSVTWGRVSYLPQGTGGGRNWQDKIPRWLYVKILLVQGA